MTEIIARAFCGISGIEIVEGIYALVSITAAKAAAMMIFCWRVIITAILTVITIGCCLRRCYLPCNIIIVKFIAMQRRRYRHQRMRRLEAHECGGMMCTLDQLRIDVEWRRNVRMKLWAQQHFGVPLTSRTTTSIISSVEHVTCTRIKHPIASFAIFTCRRVGLFARWRRWRALISRHFDEAIVEAEIVSNRVLPALLVLTVVGKAVDVNNMHTQRVEKGSAHAMKSDLLTCPWWIYKCHWVSISVGAMRRWRVWLVQCRKTAVSPAAVMPSWMSTAVTTMSLIIRMHNAGCWSTKVAMMMRAIGENDYRNCSRNWECCGVGQCWRTLDTVATFSTQSFNYSIFIRTVSDRRVHRANKNWSSASQPLFFLSPLWCCVYIFFSHFNESLQGTRDFPHLVSLVPPR